METNYYLISIQRPHTINIFDKKIKGIEWRKKPLPIGHYYVYESKNTAKASHLRYSDMVFYDTQHKNYGSGNVIGEFDVIDCFKIFLSNCTENIINSGCVDIDFLVDYANGNEYLYANVLNNVHKLAKPMPLSAFTCTKTIRRYTTKKAKEFSGNSINSEKLFHANRLEQAIITSPPQSYMRVNKLEEN